MSTAYHSETNDSTEHVNQIIEAYFWMFVNYTQDNWAVLTLSVQLVINNHNTISTDMSFFFLLHDYHFNFLNFMKESENRENSNLIRAVKWMLCKFRKITEWAQTSMTMIQQFQKNYINHEWNAATYYKVDDKVWLDLQNIKTDKLMKKLDICHMKFTILEHVESYTYQLNMLLRIENIFHIYLLWSAHENSFLNQIQTNWQLLLIVINDNNDNENEKYTVERIINE